MLSAVPGPWAEHLSNFSSSAQSLACLPPPLVVADVSAISPPPPFALASEPLTFHLESILDFSVFRAVHPSACREGVCDYLKGPRGLASEEGGREATTCCWVTVPQLFLPPKSVSKATWGCGQRGEEALPE